MALDGIFLHHLKNEVAEFAVGARIDKIYQPSKEELVLSLRSREGAEKLLLSCRANTAGMYFTKYPPENPAKPPMLCMLLRKHLCGGKILSIEQQGLDRIIKITVRSSNELGDEVLLTLVAEIMGRYSNIILLDDKGTIIDALRRVDENSSRVRRVLPGLKYEAPPAQDKLDILTDDIEKIKARISKSTKSPANAFQTAVMGVSPIVCREYENGTSVEQIKLSWTRIKHPSEVVNVGDQVEVYIKSLDQENKKISLGFKKIEDSPWEILKRDYPIGTKLTAKIVGLTAFGAFATVVPGIEGLIHISEISWDRIKTPADVLKVGDEVEVVITDIDFDKKRVSLSMKQTTEKPEETIELDAE